MPQKKLMALLCSSDTKEGCQLCWRDICEASWETLYRICQRLSLATYPKFSFSCTLTVEGPITLSSSQIVKATKNSPGNLGWRGTSIVGVPGLDQWLGASSQCTRHYPLGCLGRQHSWFLLRRTPPVVGELGREGSRPPPTSSPCKTFLWREILSSTLALDIFLETVNIIENISVKSKDEFIGQHN